MIRWSHKQKEVPPATLKVPSGLPTSHKVWMLISSLNSMVIPNLHTSAAHGPEKAACTHPDNCTQSSPELHEKCSYLGSINLGAWLDEHPHLSLDQSSQSTSVNFPMVMCKKSYHDNVSMNYSSVYKHASHSHTLASVHGKRFIGVDRLQYTHLV